MASGNLHTLGTVVLTPITASAAWELTGGDTHMTLMAGLGCLSGILISPDLDMRTRTVSERYVVRMSLGLGWLWIAMWYPYALLFKHRGVSHAPICGTVSRILYMSLFYIGVAYFFYTFYQVDILVWPQEYWLQLLVFAVGLTISDLGHWVLDW